MDNKFERASRLKLRFISSIKGKVNTEDLWNMELEELDSMAIALDDQINTKQKSFLKVKSKEDEELNLKLDILKYVMETRMAEEENRRTLQAQKEKNSIILQLIAKKEGQDLEGKSIDELKAMLVNA
jgi:hypothetical protein